MDAEIREALRDILEYIGHKDLKMVDNAYLRMVLERLLTKQLSC